MALGLAFAVLIVSGLWLGSNYLPSSPARAWPDIRPTPDDTATDVIHIVHQVASYLFLVAAAVATGCGLVIACQRVRSQRWLLVIAAAVLAAAALLLPGTGTRLPWYQLTLKSVVTGTELQGPFVVFGDTAISEVWVEGDVVSPATYESWVWLHIAVLPIIAAVAGMTVLLVTRRRRVCESGSATLPD